MSGNLKTFKVKGKSNKLMSVRIDDKKLLERYKANWSKIEDVKIIKLNPLPTYDDRHKNQYKTIWR